MAEAAKKLTLLQKQTIGDNRELYDYLIKAEEDVLLEYKAIRDVAIFTTEKVVLMDVQGLTGKKKEWLVLPYSKITAYSVESAGSFDLDAECKLWASGVGFVELNFMKGTNIKDIANVLLKYIK